MAVSMRDYLKRYTDSSPAPDDTKPAKKKKKKKRKNVTASQVPAHSGVKIVDEDAVWQKENVEESADEGSDDDGPQVVKDVEVKRMQRLEAVKVHRPYLSVAGDGSGWVTVSEPINPGPLVKGSLSPGQSCDDDVVGGDSSPPRRTQHDSPPRRRNKMTDGSSAGLRTGREIAEELEKKRKEDFERISEMDASISGRGVATVYRDRYGRRLESLDELVKLQQAEKKKPEEKPLEWGRGLAQKREAEAKKAELEEEKHKPFARSRDDVDLDKLLKERVRWGDPMAHLVKKKSEPILEDFGHSKHMKESGFIVPQDIPHHSWLKRGIAPPPNRYGIKPGRHWDGVDRSNGFERDMFKQHNEKKALEQEAYLWSVSEM